MTTNDGPYTVQPANGEVVIVFVEYVDHERTPEYDRELDDLVERHTLVICDISKSKKVTSDWLRFLRRLTVKADNMGKRLVLVGMRDNVRESSDVLGLADDLELCPTLEEARG